MFEKILEWQARQHPERAAILVEGGEITYRKFANHVARMTAALEAEDLPLGVVLLSGVGNALTWLLTFALERLGRTSAVTPGRNHDVVELLRPSVVITQDQDWKTVFDERVLHPSDAWRRKALGHAPSPTRSTARDEDVVRILLSSGTTGAQKQIPITRGVLDARIGRPLLGSPAPEIRFLQSQGTDTLGGFMHPLTIWAHGGLAMMPMSITAETLQTRKPTLMAMSPARLSTTLAHMRGVFSPSDPLHIRAIGSALPPSLIRDVMSLDGVDLSVSYGSTEAGNIASGPASLVIGRPGAVGFVAPWVDLQIVREDGTPALPGESGVIRIRGGGVVDGYLGKDANSPAFRDGWFYPNDTGHIDPDGVLIIDGRSDDVLNIGGVKLSSTRVEETVLSCAGVDDAAVTVFPMSNGRWVLFAAIVSRNGVDVADIRQKVREVYEHNIEVVDLPEIARNAMGKIKRSEVRQAILSKRTSRP